MEIGSKKPKIAVLTGGYNWERNVALAGAYNVAIALRTMKYQVTIIDTCKGLVSKSAEKLLYGRQSALPREEELAHLMKEDKLLNLLSDELTKYDLVFPIMHGKGGESGILQAGLELANIPYVGSDYKASALAMDKEFSKRLFSSVGIPTPDWIKWPEDKNDLNKLSFPLIVKPVNAGSSVGISTIFSKKDLLEAVDKALKYDEEVIIEKFIKGREFTVGILDNFSLTVGEIISSGKIFDYESKYTDHGANEVFPAKISRQLEADLKNYAERVHRLLKLKYFSRTDFRVSEDNEIFVLEVNSIPGMTPLSLLPKSALASNYPFHLFCDYICKLALKQKMVF